MAELEAKTLTGASPSQKLSAVSHPLLLCSSHDDTHRVSVQQTPICCRWLQVDFEPLRIALAQMKSPTEAERRRQARFSEQGRGGGRGSPVFGGGGGGGAGGEAENDPASLVSKISLLERDLERRQESYVSRERAYKTRIEELEEELLSQRQEKTGWMKEDGKMAQLKSIQGQILNNVELVQDRTARILQEQERDLLRAFRARLFDVQTELEKEKSKKEDGAGAWIERCHQLESEVEWAKEVADRLERVNQTLIQENSRLKSQFNSQEEDRNFLIKQLVSVKKDNARLRAEYTAMEVEYVHLQQQIKDAALYKDAPGGHHHATLGNSTSTTKPGHHGGGAQPKGETEDRYKEVNTRLRRLLADERRNLQQVRQNYAQELKSRTEIEMLLRQCVEDVRKEIARRHVESAQFSSSADLSKLYNRQPGTIPIEDFTQEDRERALELLLSQERVVTLLYAKSFPVNVKSKSASLALEDSGIHHPHQQQGLDEAGGDKLPALLRAPPSAS